MDEQDLRRQGSREAIIAIQYHAGQIHDLIEPGMTVDVIIQNNSPIINPACPNIAGRLIITRPIAVLQVRPK